MKHRRSNSPPQDKLVGLDALRGAAALLVLVSHARAYTLQNGSELSDPGLLLKAFYFITGSGHQAVVIFFALSGFLVGGKALGDFVSGRFSWPEYLLRRLTRLWVVIIPALLATVAFDSLGQSITGGIGYDGSYYDVFFSGPGKALGTDLTLRTFVGNVAFLQTIAVPVFGSNGPMWSLANEFWYYMTFPLAVWIIIAPWGKLTRAFVLLALIATFIFVAPGLLIGGLVWIAGAAACWCSRSPILEGLWKQQSLRIGAATLFFLLLIGSRIWPTIITDFWLGMAVALALPAVANLPGSGRIVGKIARATSELSYSLYLTHFPLLTMVIFSIWAPQRFAPNLVGFAVFFGLVLLALLWASIFWFFFERQTDRVYRGIVSSRFWLNSRNKRAETNIENLST